MKALSRALPFSLLALALVVCPLAARAQDVPAPDSLTFSELQPGVWLHTTWWSFPGGFDVPANGLVVLSEGGLWLVDTAWGDGFTEQLLDRIDREIGLPVVGAIAAHHHDDSTDGIPALAARGVPTYAQERTVEILEELGGPLPESLGKLAPGKSVTIGGLVVFYPGAAHSEDNVMVWVPGARLLFGGCAVRPGGTRSLGNTADADLASWPEAIRRARDRFPDAEIVVPSHGPPGDASLLAHTIGLFEAR